MSTLTRLGAARPRGQYAIMACLTVFSLTQGLSYPLLALALKARGHDEAAIGLSAAMTALGVLLAGFVLSPLVRRIGAQATVLGASALGALLWIGLAGPDDYLAWADMRPAIGGLGGARKPVP